MQKRRALLITPEARRAVPAHNALCIVSSVERGCYSPEEEARTGGPAHNALLALFARNEHVDLRRLGRCDGCGEDASLRYSWHPLVLSTTRSGNSALETTKPRQKRTAKDGIGQAYAALGPNSLSLIPSPPETCNTTAKSIDSNTQPRWPCNTRVREHLKSGPAERCEWHAKLGNQR